LKVYIKTPARLHLGLIDLNGSMGRMYGGLGVGIDRPNVIIEAEHAPTLTVTGQRVQFVTELARQFFKAYQIKQSGHIHVKQTIPAHTGLGSGTQFALAVATVLAKLNGINASTPELALAMGRAKLTSVGTTIFQNGGFVVDGGKKIAQDNCFPPIIYQHSFPEDWRFIVAIPNIEKGLSNAKEKAAFNKLPPMQTEDVAKICHLTMLKLLPALVEKDLKSFSEALTAIQIVTGNYFASVQGGTYANVKIAETIEYIKQLGICGFGQSSWGPTLYGIVEQNNAKEVLKKVKNYLTKNVGGEAFVAKANNKGATIKITKTV